LDISFEKPPELCYFFAMKTEDLNYDLPAELIAQTPAEQRKTSRLLVLDRKNNSLSDLVFTDLIRYLDPGDCLVLNNTKVIPARFYAQKPSGAQLEGLFLHEDSPGCWQVLLKNARKINSGNTLEILDRDFNPCCRAIATKTGDKGQWQLTMQTSMDAFSMLEKIGYAPLPPYIKRSRRDVHNAEDLRRYQTVYAEQAGAVAAPTAGLHFDRPLLEAIEAKGVKAAYITLHVGIGTFRPIQTETMEEHRMHAEHYEITRQAAETVTQAIRSGGRIIAVGTTSVRTLESVAENGLIRAEKGQTRLFIRPGYEFQIVNAIVTNFHLPKSSLLALVGAFAGMERILNAYRHAIGQKYRFYSYGDAMLIL
jgi:S-adenosylmethionine:tRNA ribosyltransferase-isomerase